MKDKIKAIILQYQGDEISHLNADAMTNQVMQLLEYPHKAAKGKTDTSEAAAKAIDRIRGGIETEVYRCLQDYGPRGTEQIAELIGRKEKSVQPRTSELKAKGRIKDSGKRRQRKDGKREIIWEINNAR